MFFYCIHLVIATKVYLPNRNGLTCRDIRTRTSPSGEEDRTSASERISRELELAALFREVFRQLPDTEISSGPCYLPGPFLDAIESSTCSFTPVTGSADL